MTILAALIEYDVDGVTKYLGVTDGAYTDTTGVSLEDGLWYPALSSDVNWSESARHPYQEQGGELVVGDLVLQNDGTFDFLMDADIVGMKVTLKRGDKDEAFADMEQIFIARIAGRRFEGHSVIIELDNWLAKLSGPVYTETFGSDVPNPQLVGKQIPYVLGKVTQAPVLLYDANSLTYYTAANTSLIGEVAEGGNPTQKWYLNSQPTFDLKGSPTLPITATYEGPSDTAWTTIIDDDLSAWDTGSDTALTSPYTNRGNHPTGWTLIVGSVDGNVAVAQSSGMQVSAASATISEPTTTGSVATSDAESVSIGSSITKWTSAASAVASDPGSATISTSGDKTDALEATITGFESALAYLRVDGSIASGSIAIDYVEVRKSGLLVYRETLDQPLSTGTLSDLPLSGLWDSITPEELGDDCQLRLKLRDDVEGSYSVNFFFLYGSYLSSPSVHLRRDLSLVSGRPYSVQIEGNADDASSFMWGAHNDTEVDWPEHAEYPEFINQDSADTVNGLGFVMKSTIVPSGSVFNFSHQPAFGYDGEYKTGTFAINRIKITEQSAGNKSYKSLAPHVIETAGYTSSEYDQTTFNTHADEYGDPELGWLVLKNESADQVLFRLAGSLNGYVWHGLDGKVRSKRLKAPTPVDDPFVIDGANASLEQIVAYDDPAPNLRKSVNALRNWQPLDPDSTAGIATTWTEEDRAKVTTDWRITRAWEMGTDGKDEFTRRWPNVASREPFATALRDATTCQLIANEGPDTWIQRPMFYEVPVYVDKGEFSKVATGETVKAELDYPGLEDTWLLVLGRSGTSQPGMVNLTLWSAGQSPVALLSPYRFDPRITFTRSSTATYFDADGVLQTAAVDEARLDYDPSDNSVKGWLFEESRTNRATQSESLGHADWTEQQVSVTADAATAPDGTTSADKIVEDSNSGVHRIYQNISGLPDNTTCTASFFLKAAERPEANVFLRLKDGSTKSAYFDLTAGTIGTTSSGATARIKDAGGGWYRCSVSADILSGATAPRMAVYVVSAGEDIAYTGDGSSGIYAWGAQCEEGDAASSYIATTTAAVTRSADGALIGGTEFSQFWNDSEGTIVAEVAPAYVDTEVFVSASDGTTNNRIILNTLSAGTYRAFVSDGGSTQASITGNAISEGTLARLAFGFKANDYTLYNDGSLEGSDTSGSLPTVTQLSVGEGSASGTFPFNGHIKALHYYPTKLSDSQLESASTLGRDLILDKV